MATAIMTDTNSGFAGTRGSDSVPGMPGLFVLPMPVLIDGKSHFEGVDITHEDLYAAMRAKREVHSSQPAPGDFIDMWNAILSAGYDDLVYIPMSSSLSSSCETAKYFAEAYTGKVYVADNRRISVTLHESVREAAAMARAGLGAEAIVAALEADAANSSIYITVDSLEYLKRSGRVTAAGAAIADVLNLKPVLTIQGGKLDAFAKVRGMKNSEKRMVEAVGQDIRRRFANWPASRIRIGAAGTFEIPEDAERWTDQLRTAFPESEVYYQPLSCSIACHVGINAAGVGVSCVRDIT